MGTRVCREVTIRRKSRFPGREPRAVRALRVALAELSELELAPARARAASLLGQFTLDASLREFALEVLQRQRATAGVADTLAALADFLGSRVSTRSVTSRPPLPRLVAWPYADTRSHIAIIPPSDLVYAFTVGALTQGFVKVAWRLDALGGEPGVYLRVNRLKGVDPQGVGVLATPYRTLRDVHVLLDSSSFVPANQSTLVNCAYIRDVDTSAPVTLRVVLMDGRLESLHVSRAAWPALQRALGVRARISRQPTVAGVDP
jgi:hypothetical protein